MSLPLHADKYIARATGARFGLSSKGNHQIAVDFRVDDGEFTGETISWVGTFTDKASKWTIEALRNCGWQGDDLSELETGAESLLTEHVELVCETETYEDKERLRVKFINRVGAGRMAFKAPVAGNDLKTFAASMKATIRSVSPATQRAAQPAAAPAPAGNGTKPSGDLPF